MAARTPKIPIIECSGCGRAYWTPSPWYHHKVGTQCDGNGRVRCLSVQKAEAKVWATIKAEQDGERGAFLAFCEKDPTIAQRGEFRLNQ